MPQGAPKARLEEWSGRAARLGAYCSALRHGAAPPAQDEVAWESGSVEEWRAASGANWARERFPVPYFALAPAQPLPYMPPNDIS
jgi:hypothetical protein